MQDPDTLFDFDHLEPTGTIEHTLVGVHVPPSNKNPVILELAHAGQGNERYLKAVKNAAAKGAVSEADTVAIFAKTVCRGWKNVLDLAGKPVPFTPALAESMLLKLLEKNRNDIVARALDRAAETHRFVRGGDDLGKE